VYVLPYQGEPELPQDPIEWPLEPPPLGFGEPVQNANALTPWTSGGNEYRLIFRPLLPDEHAC
jgi:hypothetical protein